MKKATITETKNQLSALLDAVKQGETVLIMERDRPIARLEPALGQDTVDPEGRLARLERAGTLLRPKSKLDEDFLEQSPPRLENGASVLEALLSERNEGR